MATVHYTARVKDHRTLELPEAAQQELQLKPGDLLDVSVELPSNPAIARHGLEGLESPRIEKGPQKQLRGLGMLAGVLSSEDFLRRKHEETAREDGNL